MQITLHSADFKTAFTCNLSPAHARRIDNGHLISIGLIIGEDVKPATLKRWIKSGKARPADVEKAKHSGCQSRCKLRGDSVCQW